MRIVGGKAVGGGTHRSPTLPCTGHESFQVVARQLEQLLYLHALEGGFERCLFPGKGREG